MRRAQFRAADDPARCAAIARAIIAGKLQNSRNSILRAARETELPGERSQLDTTAESLARQIQELGRWTPEDLAVPKSLDALRGAEGMGAQSYFAVFSLLLKQQRDPFAFTTRSRRPPRDRINCLSFRRGFSPVTFVAVSRITRHSSPNNPTESLSRNTKARELKRRHSMG